MTNPRNAEIPMVLVGIGFLVRCAFAIANSYWLNLSITDVDGFHRVAADIAGGQADFLIQIGWVYSDLLALVYKVTGPHLVVASLLSAVAWLLSALTLKAVLDLLDTQPRNQIIALAIFALLPSSILFSALPFRDVYELLFVTLTVYGVVRFADKRDGWSVAITLLSGLAGELLHAGLMPLSAIAAISLVVMSARHREPQSLPAYVVAVFVSAMLAITGLLFYRYGYTDEIARGGGIVGASEQYQASLNSTSRTTYSDLIAFSLPFPQLARIAVQLLQYMLEPLPWHVQNIGDLGILLENALRVALFLAAVWALRGKPANAGIGLILLFAYCCLEGTWSLGTGAWGTAIRHHLPGTGLLLVCAFAILPAESGSKNAAGAMPRASRRRDPVV